jgi:hypothetical protein
MSIYVKVNRPYTFNLIISIKTKVVLIKFGTSQMIYVELKLKSYSFRLQYQYTLNTHKMLILTHTEVTTTLDYDET